MLSIDRSEFHQYSDVLRTRTGELVTLRFAEPEDADALQRYFRGLSVRSRYNRLMGAASELPAGQLDQFTHILQDGRFSVIAVMKQNGAETIVGEARYAFDDATGRFELGLSVDDLHQGQGLGAAVLSNLECRAAAFGAEHLFGDTLRSNDAMLAVAMKSGFVLAATPGDWKQVRFEKHIDIAAQDIPCASWRMAAQNLQSVAAI